jgi:hypothetical protein
MRSLEGCIGAATAGSSSGTQNLFSDGTKAGNQTLESCQKKHNEGMQYASNSAAPSPTPPM